MKKLIFALLVLPLSNALADWTDPLYKYTVTLDKSIELGKVSQSKNGTDVVVTCKRGRSISDPSMGKIFWASMTITSYNSKEHSQKINEEIFEGKTFLRAANFTIQGSCNDLQSVLRGSTKRSPTVFEANQGKAKVVINY